MTALIIGGTSSGKSQFAEDLITRLQGLRKYIATMEPLDKESQDKIDRHRQMRKDKDFTTVEIPRNLKSYTFNSTDAVLLECMSNLLANEMYGKDHCQNPVEEITQGVDNLMDSCRDVIIVTNQIFCDGVDYQGMEDYIENLGTINSYIARKAQLVVEVVAGIPIVLKGEEILSNISIRKVNNK